MAPSEPPAVSLHPQPYSLPCRSHTFLPSLLLRFLCRHTSFDSFVGIPVSIHQERDPSFPLNVVDILSTPSRSPLLQPLMSAHPGSLIVSPLPELSASELYIQGALIIYPNELPRSVRETFSASLTEVTMFCRKPSPSSC